mgnify:CR=1 FL=1
MLAKQPVSMVSAGKERKEKKKKGRVGERDEPVIGIRRRTEKWGDKGMIMQELKREKLKRGIIRQHEKNVRKLVPQTNPA